MHWRNLRARHLVPSLRIEEANFEVNNGIQTRHILISIHFLKNSREFHFKKTTMKKPNPERAIQNSITRYFIAVFYSLVFVGFISIAFIFYNIGTVVREKKKQEIYTRAYVNGYEHARLKFDNPQPKNLKTCKTIISHE